jgi:D-glycero-D-manno-heptose 1,7-bisphosphate phosphatase
MPVVFLDRDGVINENRDDHVKSWNEFHFIPGSLHAIQMLREAGIPVFVVTNQAAVGRGMLSKSMLEDMHARMQAQVLRSGGKIHDIRYCPHLPTEACTCRKPQPGMILDLAKSWHLDLNNAYLVGDALTDIEAASTAGCRSVLVKTGRGTDQLEQLPHASCQPNTITANLYEAVMWILARENNLLHYDDPHTSRRYYSAPLAFPAGK